MLTKIQIEKLKSLKKYLLPITLFLTFQFFYSLNLSAWGSKNLAYTCIYNKRFFILLKLWIYISNNISHLVSIMTFILVQDHTFLNFIFHCYKNTSSVCRFKQKIILSQNNLVYSIYSMQFIHIEFCNNINVVPLMYIHIYT